MRPAHPDFPLLVTSWDLAMRADGYAQRTLDSYGRAVFTAGIEGALWAAFWAPGLSRVAAADGSPFWRAASPHVGRGPYLASSWALSLTGSMDRVVPGWSLWSAAMSTRM